MKSTFVLAIFTLALMATACGGKNDGENELWQAHTSFVISNQKTADTLFRVVSGYFDNKGYCWKIAEHGTLAPDSVTTETILDDVDSVYIYYNLDSHYIDRYIVRLALPLIAQKNRKNIFVVNDTTWIDVQMIGIDKDSTSYPQ